MICALSIKLFGIGPGGFCFGPGTRFRGVRALMTRKPKTDWTLNLLVVVFNLRVWESKSTAANS